MKQEDLKKYWEEEERLHRPQPPLSPPTLEEIAELRAIMAQMDGHLTEELMLDLRVEVERMISWEDRHASQ